MARKIIYLAVLAIFLFFARAQEVYAIEWGEIKFGCEVSYTDLEITGDAVPEAVKMEAANPTIYHHRSGNTFTKGKIGVFNPGESFKGFEVSIYLRLLSTNWRIRPFLELGINHVFTKSTNDGHNTIGYSYCKTLGSGIDRICYWYGIDYNMELFSPAIGVSFDIAGGNRLVARVKYQELELDYEKGREAFGKPEGIICLASEKYEIYTFLLGLEFYKNDVLYIIGPQYRSATKGMKGGLSGSMSVIINIKW